MTNPYKTGSRKAAVYDVFLKEGGGEKGLAAATKLAKKEGLAPGTVKSWASGWLKGQTKPKAKEGAGPAKEGKAPTLKAISKSDNEYHPLFKYSSRERADREHEALCTRAGLRPHAFHVIENDGRFAVAPAHYKPGGPPPKFEVGDIVYDALIANSKAKVISAGSEQCVVRYVKERKTGPREDCVINRFLVKLPDTKEKVTRERLPDNKKLQKAADASGALVFGKKKVKREKL